MARRRPTLEEFKSVEIKVHLGCMAISGSPPTKAANPSLVNLTRLQEAARDAMFYDVSGEGNVSLSITHIRPEKTIDSVAIIGGIIDALTDIAYVDPLQVTEVFYVEESGEPEEYHVTVSMP